MFLKSALSRLLAILAVVSLVTGGTAGSGKAAPVNNMTVMMVTSDAEMTPCGQSQPPDCGDMSACPFAVVCIAKCPLNVPSLAMIRRVLPGIAPVVQREELQRSSVASSPLDHPPKA